MYVSRLQHDSMFEEFMDTNESEITDQNPETYRSGDKALDLLKSKKETMVSPDAIIVEDDGEID